MVTETEQARVETEMAAAQVVEEKSVLNPGDQVTAVRADGGESALGGPTLPATVVEVSGPDKVTVWHTDTYEPAVINRLMLRMQMEKRIPGTDRPAFTATQPRDADGKLQFPVRGTRLCRLHADAPNRKLYDTWGLLVCKKSNLRSEMDVITHMQRSHKREYATVEHHQQELEKGEEREDRRVFRKLLENTIPQTETEAPAEVAENGAVAVADPLVAVACSECNFVATKPTKRGAVSSIRTHMGKKHKGA
jgi:hypothetical protein